MVGDVTGHGMQGAMNAVMTDEMLRAFAGELETLLPALLMTKLNHALKPQMEDQMNVTMVIGLINAGTKTLTLANAAHHAHPLLIRNGEMQPLIAKGMPLGMMAGIKYSEVEFPLQSGDVITFMTDGIIEAHNNQGREYQESERLQQVLTRFTAEMSADAMVDAVIDDVAAFSGETAEQEDDITVVVVKVQ